VSSWGAAIIGVTLLTLLSAEVLIGQEKEDYNVFFQEWYHSRLRQHGDDVLSALVPLIRQCNVQTVCLASPWVRYLTKDFSFAIHDGAATAKANYSPL
jgi:hypothetical protein